MNTINRYYY